MIIKIHKKMDFISHKGKLVAETSEKLKEAIKLGISTLKLDRIADKYIRFQKQFIIYRSDCI